MPYGRPVGHTAQVDLDDAALRAAMRDYTAAADALDQAARAQADPRVIVDLAEGKALAAMLLRKRLAEVDAAGSGR